MPLCPPDLVVTGNFIPVGPSCFQQQTICTGFMGNMSLVYFPPPDTQNSPECVSLWARNTGLCMGHLISEHLPPVFIFMQSQPMLGKNFSFEFPLFPQGYGYCFWVTFFCKATIQKKSLYWEDYCNRERITREICSAVRQQMAVDEYTKVGETMTLFVFFFCCYGLLPLTAVTILLLEVTGISLLHRR